jgi:hypothetical protein
MRYELGMVVRRLTATQKASLKLTEQESTRKLAGSPKEVMQWGRRAEGRWWGSLQVLVGLPCKVNWFRRDSSEGFWTEE